MILRPVVHIQGKTIHSSDLFSSVMMMLMMMWMAMMMMMMMLMEKKKRNRNSNALNRLVGNG